MFCFISALICLSALLIVSAIRWPGRVEWRWKLIVSYAFLLIAFIFAVCTSIVEDRKRIYSSVSVWLMLMVAVAVGSFRFVGSIINAIYPTIYVDTVSSCMFIPYYAFTAITFILAWFTSADTPPDSYESLTQPIWPENYCSFPNRLFYIWFTRLIKIGYKAGLRLNDVWFVSEAETTKAVYSEFGGHWHTEFDSTIEANRFGYKPDSDEELNKPSLIRAIRRCYGGWVLLAAIGKFFYDLLLFTEPFIVKLMIEFYEDSSLPTWHGYMYIATFGFLMVIRTVISHTYFDIMTRIGVKTRTAIVSAVYRKSLRLTAESRMTWTAGEIVNLVSVDASRFRDAATNIHLLWSAPLQLCSVVLLMLVYLQLVLGCFCLYTAVGHAVWPAVGFLIVVVIVNVLSSAAFEKFMDRQMVEKDRRMKLLTEVINGIKVLKLYAWELAFQRQIESIRSNEIKHIRHGSHVNSVMEFSWSCTTLVTSLILFAVYISMAPSNVLTANIVFFIMTVFNIITVPFAMLPHVMADSIMLSVSVKRLNAFFGVQERPVDQVSRNLQTPDVAVKFSNCTFSWKSNVESPTLKNIDLQLIKGKLYGVVGPIGSGKSSLLLSMLGEMHKHDGLFEVNESLGYVSQQAWIQNATFRDNILFGKGLDQARYDRVIDVCALQSDLILLANGHTTEIGERGMNLSGGQKLRMNLARAVYQDKAIYLLDDPLSAVDADVGKHLFDQVIGPQSILQQKTRVLVTHDMRLLPQCDGVFVMENGRIVQQAHNPADIAALLLTLPKPIESEHQASEFAILDADDSLEGIPDTEAEPSIPANVAEEPSTPMDDPNYSDQTPSEDDQYHRKLVLEESSKSGEISLSVIKTYIRSCGCWLILFVVALTLCSASNIVSVWWLQQWTDSIVPYVSNISSMPFNQNYGLTYYGICTGMKVILTIAYVWFFTQYKVYSAKRLHENLLHGILRAPILFFYRTPTGRIINRCGQDINTVDNHIPFSVDEVCQAFLLVLEAVIGVTYAMPYFGIAVVPFIVFYLFIQRYYIRTARQLRRLEAISRSPIFSHFYETLSGVSSIRAYGCQTQFIDRSSHLVDVNNSAQLAFLASNRWVGVRLELLGSLFVCTSATIVVVMRDYGITSGLIGMALTQSLLVTGGLSLGALQMTVLETEIIAVERINEYANTSPEGEWTNGENYDNWPNAGKVEFRNYSTRYREGLPLALNNLSIKFNAGDKVGIIGRTGSGKSSLTLALFRLLEATEGSVLLDDRNIASMGYHDLRKKLSVIPQEPILFTGSLRFNIDPFYEYDDEMLWSVLELCQLKTFVSSFPEKLDHEISEGGCNLSVGQRQLVCLVRAVLRKSKILLLDEATASVDINTDNLVHETVQKCFKDCTVITIAHRLNAIRDCNKILVLDSGKVVEFGEPAQLLSKEDGYFRKVYTNSKRENHE